MEKMVSSGNYRTTLADFCSSQHVTSQSGLDFVKALKQKMMEKTLEKESGLDDEI